MLCNIILAQKTISPEWLTIEDGLSQSFVSSIMQDKEGFIWMGTKNGLNRYDGRQFENFAVDNKKTYALKNDNILSMHDDDGFSLFGTYEGLFLLQKSTKRFYSIELPNDTKGENIKPAILEIVKDNKGNYWLSEIKTGSLYHFELSSKFYDQVKTSNLDLNTISVALIKQDEEFIPNNICIYQNDLIFISRKLENEAYKYTFNALNTGAKSIEKLKDIPLEKHLGAFWIKPYKEYLLFSNWVEQKLYVYKNEKWHTITTDFSIATFAPLKKNNKLIINTGDESLFFDDTILEKNQLLKSEALSIIENKRTNHNDVIQDNSGVTWVATANNGVFKVAPRELNIETVFTGISIYAKPFIFKNNDVYIDNPSTDERMVVAKSKNNPRLTQNVLSNMEHWSFVNAKNNQVWAYNWVKGKNKIGLIDENGVFKNSIELFESGTPTTPLFYYDTFKNDVVFVSDTRMFIYSIDNKLLKTYNLNTYLNAFDRYSITKTANGYYWIGTNRGLIQCKLNDSRVIEFKIWNRDKGLQSNQVASLLVDNNNDNILWVGTKGGGLHKMDIINGTFKNFNIKDGFPDNVIYGVLEDEKNNLWMSSNKGIIAFNKDTQAIRNYTKADGLQSNEFNTYAYNKMEDGTMVFGGINGLNIFHPNDFENNKNTPSVWITNLEVNNKEVDLNTNDVLSKTIELTSKITLPFNKNSISLRFSALEFTAPQKNTFSYYMEGLEEEWIHTSLENKANYLSMPPGHYTFKIKAANGDGIWSDAVKELKVRVLPPWYRTNLVYICYSLGILFLFWSIVRVREDKIRRAEEIEKSELQNKLLKTEINYKQKDLEDFAVAISENQKWGDYLLEKIKNIRDSKGRTKGKLFDDLEENIKNKTYIQNNQVDFQNKIDVLNNEFYQTLLSQFPNLSKTDLRLCTFIRLDLSTNDIAMMQNITQESVYRSRNRLRKKLEISPDIDLNVFLKQF